MTSDHQTTSAPTSLSKDKSSPLLTTAVYGFQSADFCHRSTKALRFWWRALGQPCPTIAERPPLISVVGAPMLNMETFAAKLTVCTTRETWWDEELSQLCSFRLSPSLLRKSSFYAINRDILVAGDQSSCILRPLSRFISNVSSDC